MIAKYVRPADLAEALYQKAHLLNSVYLAGGTEVNSLSYDQQCFSAVDVSHLLGKTLSEDAGQLVIEAGITIEELLHAPLTPALLRQSCKQFSSRYVRCQATLGGNIGVCSSSSNAVAGLLALDAQLDILTSGGASRLSLAEYIANHSPEALVTGVRVPLERAKAAWATRKYGRTAADMSVLLSNVVYSGKPSCLHNVSIVLGGVAATPIRLTKLEQQLEGQALPERAALENMVKELVAPIADIRGSAAFKREVAAVITAWALHNAVQEA